MKTIAKLNQQDRNETDCRYPWRVIEVNGIWEVWTAEDDRPGSLNNYCIAAEIQDEREAELIASAPFLLVDNALLREALQEVYSVWAHNCGRVFESMGEQNPRAQAIDTAIESARSAIARAKGQGKV